MSEHPLIGQVLAVELAEAGHVVVPVPPKGKLPHPKQLRRDANGKPSVAATIANPLTSAEVAAVRTKGGKPWQSVLWGLYVTGRLIVVDADDPHVQNRRCNSWMARGAPSIGCSTQHY